MIDNSWIFPPGELHMGLNTRMLGKDEAQAATSTEADASLRTAEVIRVNALMFLNEMAKPVRSPSAIEVHFAPVPRSPTLRDRMLWQEVQPWHVVIMPTEAPRDFLALELLGDTVIGSNDLSEVNLDVNLAAFHGYDYGVSRRHVLLRPTRDKLYAIDLHSTNGTAVNGMPSPVGEAHALRDGDLLSLGCLHLQIKVARRPEPSR